VLANRSMDGDLVTGHRLRDAWHRGSPSLAGSALQVNTQRFYRDTELLGLIANT